MASLLLQIFLLQLLTLLVSSYLTPLTPFLWQLYLRLPTPTRKLYLLHRSQKQQFLTLQSQIRATSAQDSFAAWAKLTRSRDALSTKLEKNSSSLTRHEAAFKSAIMALRWVVTLAVWAWTQFWGGKRAVFWVGGGPKGKRGPAGALPWWVEWILSFPRAERGAVSCQVWAAVCARVLKGGIDGIGAGWKWGFEGTGNQASVRRGNPEASAYAETPTT